MEIDFLPISSGVYQIKCIANGKIYIGGAIRLRQRWEGHKRCLRRGKHRNAHLQNAWNKFGEKAFEFVVLEFADSADLLRVEQQWLDKTKCTDKEIGFNLYPRAGSPGDSHVKIWEGFVDPSGKEIVIVNLFKFCHENELDFPSMLRLSKGKCKLKSYKGWTHRNSPRQRDYVKTYGGFINPEGQRVGLLPIWPNFVAGKDWIIHIW